MWVHNRAHLRRISHPTGSALDAWEVVGRDRDDDLLNRREMVTHVLVSGGSPSSGSTERACVNPVRRASRGQRGSTEGEKP